MKKVLSRIVSTALMAATVATPVMAQMAKKAGASGTRVQNTVAAKAESKQMRSVNKNGSKMHFQTSRKASGPFTSAKRGPLTAAPRQNANAPRYEAANLPEMYGSVIYNDQFNSDEAVAGLYEMPKSAGAATMVYAGPNANGRAVCVDDVYYATNYFSFFGMMFITTTAYDFESGDELGSFDSTDLQVIGTYALDPTTQQVYGITYNAAGDGRQLTKIDLSLDGISATAIAPLGGNWNSIAFDASGQLYGISYEGETQDESFVVLASALNKIDKTTGAVTKVGETGVAPQYLSSSAIDHKSGKMYWNVCPADENGYMYEVNLATGAATLLYQLQYNDEVMGLVIPAPAAADKAPGECEVTNTIFNGASLEGFMYVTAPATLFDGTAGTGKVNLHVDVDGENLANINNVDYGEQVLFNLDLTSKGAGMYTFTVYATNSVGDGPKTKVKNIWVGADTPEATKASLAYVNGNMEVTWNAVTGSVNGGYIDLDNLTYTVKRADGSVAASGLTTTTFTEAVAEPASLTSYYYTVEVVCGDMVSAPARTNTVVLGSIVPPYTSDFAADGLEGWTVIDANDDGKVWTVYQGEARMAYNSALDMDDWLITAPVKLEGGKGYNLTFSAHSNGATFPEMLEVKMGKAATVEGMTETLVDKVVLESSEPVEFNKMIMPETDGVYYIGFHGVSEADMFYLYLGNITIEAGVSTLAPGLATDLVVTPDATGALKANVSFKAPTVTMNNETLSSLEKVELLRGEEVVNTFANPQPGQSLSFDDTMTDGGDVTYSVVGYNDHGAGLKATATAFVGFNVPAAPANVVIARTSTVGEVVLNWDPVTVDINGLAYPAGEVTYMVVDADSMDILAEGVTSTSYSYQAIPAGEQDFVQLGVFAVSAAGQSKGVASDMIPVGTPYNGIEESFADKSLSYIWGLRPIDGGSVSLFSDEDFENVGSCDGDNGFIGIKGQYLDTGAEFFSGLVSLNQMENAALTFYTYNIGGDDANEITVSVRTVDGASESEYAEVLKAAVADLVSEEGWGKVTVPLTAYENKTIQFMITGLTKQYVYTMLDQIKVGSIFAYDLKANGISAPAKVKAGEDYTVEVSVMNNGAQPVDSYKVDLYADGELAASKDCDALDASASVNVKFERTMSAIATEPVEYYAVVVAAKDEDMANNQTQTVTVAPIVSTLPVATDLKGASQPDGIKLTWNEPNLEGGVAVPVTDDFEDADGVAAEYGNWKFVDVDGAPVGGFQDNSGTTLQIPGITVGETTGSFWIWDNDEITWATGNATYEAHSGSKYLFALFRYDDGQSDEWAISPELTGDEQEISFWARSYSTSYPEKITVYYSTGSLETADFVEVSGSTVDKVPGEWTEYSYTLPAGAKYFAIRSHASGSFMLMVDDVTYTPASSTADLSIAGYNVYRDGVKINDKLVEDTSFVDGNVTDGTQYTYVVTVVYTDKGETAASNEVVITYTGTGVNNLGDGAVSVSVDGNDIVVLNAEGLPVSVASANGVVLFNGVGEVRTTVTVGNGVYVVKAGNTVRKLVVR